MKFCKDKFTVPFGATLEAEDIVLPGEGVPEQANKAKVYTVPVGKLVTELTLLLAVTIDELAGVPGVTLIKLPAAPVIPIDALIPFAAVSEP